LSDNLFFRDDDVTTDGQQAFGARDVGVFKQAEVI
jgi:hypothetical protein